jgi:catechol 2,3-dioxygenase-like lactoylglutathione lyase family enzyme
MRQFISAVAVLVPSYKEGLAFYVGKLGFRLIQNTSLGDHRRWVVVAPAGGRETRLLLARASTDEQRRAIGAQAGGRVFLFLETDDFSRDHRRYCEAGVEFLEAPREET